MSAPEREQLSPLQMARNLAATVEIIARATEQDPLQAHVAHLGERGHQAGQLAANLALVSVAEDLRRIVDIMTGHGDPAAPADPWAAPADQAVAAWVRDNTDQIRQAIFDATEYRDEHSLAATGRQYDRLATEFSEMTGRGE